MFIMQWSDATIYAVQYMYSYFHYLCMSMSANLAWCEVIFALMHQLYMYLHILVDCFSRKVLFIAVLDIVL